MKIEDRQSQGGFQEVDPTFFFFPLLRTRMAFRSPFSATINALLPEASSSKRAEQPRRKAYSHATTKDKEIRAGNRERGKPLKIQYIIGCVAEGPSIKDVGIVWAILITPSPISEF